jgi:serine/threonine protein kinase
MGNCFGIIKNWKKEDKRKIYRNIKENYIEIKPLIKSSSNLDIYLSKNIIDNKLYVIKGKTNYDKIINERNILEKCNCDNIIKLIGVYSANGIHYNVLEYNKGIDLFDYFFIYKNPKNENIIKKIAYQTGKGLEYLHNKGIVHRDIKLENIIINNDNIKIIDFDLAIDYKMNGRMKIVGTTAYIAPEVLNKIIYCNLNDIWSYGVTLYCLFFDLFPFHGCNVEEVIILQKKKIIYDDSILSYNALQFIKNCLIYDYMKRKEIKRLINMPWFDDICDK